jgi:hypothetical protein
MRLIEESAEVPFEAGTYTFNLAVRNRGLRCVVELLPRHRDLRRIDVMPPGLPIFGL